MLNPPLIVGHRGACSNAPENTLAGLRRAHAEGATWVEFDVKLTADAVPVLIHDETLDRTTDGRGPVRQRTLAEIERLDAGGWFSPAFAGERIPTLAEALDCLAGLDMGFNLEIKPCPGREAETARRALAVLAEHWPAGRPVPIVSSFQAESLIAARQAAPHLPRGYLVETLPEDWLAQARALDCQAIHPNWRGLTSDRVRAIKAAGYKLLVWTVNDKARARELVEWGVDSLITDAPAAIAAAVSAQARAAR